MSIYPAAILNKRIIFNKVKNRILQDPNERQATMFDAATTTIDWQWTVICAAHSRVHLSHRAVNRQRRRSQRADIGGRQSDPTAVTTIEQKTNYMYVYLLL